MAVRAKFTVSKVARMNWGSGVEITMTPQYDTSIPEDQRFSKATPSGTLTMHVDNPAAAEQLELGKTFYLDFTEVPSPAPKS